MAARAGLLALLFAAAQPSWPANAGTNPRYCEAIQAALRKLEIAATDVLGEMEKNRREAQKLVEWFGMEALEPYINKLRAQEEELHANSSNIRRLACQPTTAAPPKPGSD
jgi:trans-aconitate methyltransferase